MQLSERNLAMVALNASNPPNTLSISEDSEPDVKLSNADGKLKTFHPAIIP